MSVAAFPVLALESGLMGSWVAVRLADGTLIQASVPVRSSNNEELGLLVQRVLTEAGLKPADLQTLVLGAGPGSFTGLRIGFSFTQGLAAALRIPVIKVPSLRACARAYLNQAEVLTVMIDARRAESFCALYERDGAGYLQVHFEDLILSEDELWRRVMDLRDSRGVKGQEFCLVTDSEPTLPWRGCHACKPQGLAAALISLAGEAHFDILMTHQLADLRPNYVRAVSAKTIQERIKDSADRRSGID
ncbi:MAG: tRNA (adenosine(37)-N6)-threonylcarbamoyltransferase complex dimerization subunit type 1 TsaB [Deltaproteobacteria bacterium]|nr:tRNA (adenosine(37)-N6)-threonylcarbamoyltransferase complex dimerization subunit type 1 TsaB [Deltaproteobacteria bacterium]